MAFCHTTVYFFFYLWSIAVVVVELIAFFAILFLGRYPKGLFEFTLDYIRYTQRVCSYFPFLLVGQWVPDDNHPLKFEVPYPDKLSRGILLLKLLSGILGIVGSLITLVIWVLSLFAIIAWFAILFTGRYPRGMHRVAVMMLQWSARVHTWQYLLCDEWSLFGTTTTVKVLVVIGIIASIILTVIQIPNIVAISGTFY
ncbi:DUF4389 domain-containing protein [Chloroflexota bacterium]